MNILIADDNKYARFSLKSMLSYIAADDCEIFEAANGMEMIERCSVVRPSIVFVDINIPLLDGVTAIGKCQDLSPETYFVILTGASDFSYARQCVPLNIFAHIQKPVEIGQLQEIYRKLSGSVSHDRYLSNLRFQAKYIQLFYTLSEAGFDAAGGDEYEYFRSTKREFFGAVFFIDCVSPISYSSVYKSLFDGLNGFFDSLLGKDYNYATFPFEEAPLTFILGGARIDIDMIRARLQVICEQASLFTGAGRTANIFCIFTVSENIVELIKKYVKIGKNKFLRLGLSPSSVAEPGVFDESERAFLQRAQDILNFYATRDEPAFSQALSQISANVKSVCPPVLEAAASNISFITGQSVGGGGVKAFCESLRLMASGFFRSNSNTADKISIVMDFIDKNYMRDISINEIAGQLGLTPNYLSRMFRDKKQMRFIDYLTFVRILNAKKILSRTPEISIKNLALKVGYYSPRYFSSVFKKATGFYPSEFNNK